MERPDWLTTHPTPVTEVKKSTSVSITESPPSIPATTIAIPSIIQEHKGESEHVPPPIACPQLHNFWRSAMDYTIARPSEAKTNLVTTDPNNDEELTMLTNSDEKPMSIPPPSTLREARQSPWWPRYKRAAEEEIEGHLKNQTWELVLISSIPYGRNILRGKWVFDDKRGEDGKLLRFKARFVAMGNTQKKGIDFNETYAGVVIGKSFRIMLSILNENDTHEMEHWDVKMAFTQASLNEGEELYMYQPELFEKDAENFVCKLKKSLYGLKQSAKNWGDCLREFFVKSTFSQCFSDPCVYFKKVGDAWCIVSTHVDDIFVLFNQKGKAIRDNLFSKISSSIEIENLGPISWALKTSILRDREAGIIKISQEAFIRDLLKKHNIEAEKSQLVPSSDTLFDAKLNSEEDNKIDESLKRISNR